MRNLLVLAIMALSSLSAFAYDAEIDGIYYIFSGDEATVTYEKYNIIPDDIYGSGYYSSDYSGDVVIPNTVTYNNKTYNVTRIGVAAFLGCGTLTSVVIPESIVSIESGGLGMYGRSYGAFSGCTGLTSITIPNSVTNIGNYAFSGCSNLTSISIGNNVTIIGDYAFYNCTGLSSITIPNNVTSIGSAAFLGCSDLSSITIPEGVTSIGESAFGGCKLRNVLIKCTTPPSGGLAFSEQTYYHTTLYIPTGCWDAYAYDNSWYKFINIRETALTEEDVSEQQAYTLMDANTFTYSVYDPVNDCIGTINSVSGINEDNPNHSWQMIEAGGMRYLYNIGAKKYVKRNGNRLDLTDTPEPIEMEDSDNGIILGAQANKQWALVSNERMSVAQAAIDEVTGIRNLTPAFSQGEGDIYDLSGRKMVNGKWLNGKWHGIYIKDGRKFY